MNRPAFFHASLLLWSLFLLSPGCGTDVGNAGKPLISDGTELASVVGMQHDEVISSVTDGNDNDSSAAMALQSGPSRSEFAAIEASCAPKADGSVEVKVTRNLDLQTEFGRATRRKVQKDTLNASIITNYSVPVELGILSCVNNKPSLNPLQLTQLKTVTALEKTRNRSVTVKADGSIVNESSLTAKSERTVQFAKTSASLDPLIWTRTTTIKSTITLDRGADKNVLNRTVETLADEPIVLQKTRTRKDGITSVKIVSGAIASTHQDAKRVVLRYKDLVLSHTASCHPTSGSIEGQIFASSNSAAESTFTVIFSGEGATLVQADGSEEDLELEDCQF